MKHTKLSKFTLTVIALGLSVVNIAISSFFMRSVFDRPKPSPEDPWGYNLFVSAIGLFIFNFFCF